MGEPVILLGWCGGRGREERWPFVTGKLGIESQARSRLPTPVPHLIHPTTQLLSFAWEAPGSNNTSVHCCYDVSLAPRSRQR